MKQLKSFALLISVCYCITSTAQINAGTIIRTKEVPGNDSIVFYETDYATRQKSFMNLLVGSWVITSMKRQSHKNPEHLTGVTLTLNKDSSFTGQGSCNKIWGKFSVKGTSIKFIDIASTRRACNRLEEEKWLLQLLRQAVTNYTVATPNLLLRDVSGNIVFEAERTKE